jgi:hypothetical protein
MEGHLEWTMAAPLWQFTGDPQNAEDRRQFRTPTILRFATDSFMPDFLNLLNTEPQRLNEFVAAPETWSSPPKEPAQPETKSGLALVLFRARNAAVRKLEARGGRVLGQLPGTVPGRVLKLYQPSHGRFYLIATCLVCRVLGLPDRRIDVGAQEKVSFVIRLLQPHAGADPQNPDPRQCDEFALVNGAWQALSDPATLSAGEEQKPLAPAAYVADDQRNRRLLVGLVPVGDRERLLQATQPNPAGAPPAAPLLDARQMLLKTQVIYPLKTLGDIATKAVSDATNSYPQPPTGDQANAMVAVANSRIQAVSFYVLLDLGKFFAANLPNVAAAVVAGSPSNLSTAEQAVWNTLLQTRDSGITLVQALQLASANESKLEAATTTYQPGDPGWPSFQFQFYRVTYIAGPGGQLGSTSSSSALDRGALEQLIVAALPATSPNPPLPARAVAQASANPQQPVWFTMRCVLERPNCGALTAPLVSEATNAFQMAAYFDPDAPSRPIRIGLPVDTTPAGLRKFDKNTAFVMSDVLCGQVSKMSGISFGDLIMSVLPWPLHKDLPTADMKPCPGGMVCSLSIPIITIVALILLIIFVILLDIIFFWMPFFQICLPLPKFSAKES